MKLETTRELLERVRAAKGVSWWKLQQVLEASESTVKNWKQGRTTLGREFVARVADILDEPPEYVMACVEAERDPANKTLWMRIAEKFHSTAASIVLAGLLALAGLGTPTASEAYASAVSGPRSNVLYIMRTRIREWRRWFGAQLVDRLFAWLTRTVTPFAF